MSEMPCFQQLLPSFAFRRAQTRVPQHKGVECWASSRNKKESPTKKALGPTRCRRFGTASLSQEGGCHEPTIDRPELEEGTR